MDDAAWLALTLSLTVLGGIWTWIALRRSGVVAAMRALGFTLLPVAAYLTKTLQMFTDIVDAVGRWATHLVLSPVVWVGIVIGGAGVALILGSGMMRSRQLGRAQQSAPGELPGLRTPGTKPAPTSSAETDPEMAEIEALLRKRGIT